MNDIETVERIRAIIFLFWKVVTHCGTFFFYQYSIEIDFPTGPFGLLFWRFCDASTRKQIYISLCVSFILFLLFLLCITYKIMIYQTHKHQLHPKNKTYSHKQSTICLFYLIHMIYNYDISSSFFNFFFFLFLNSL